MKSFWRWTGAIFFALVFVFLVLTGIGTSLPIDHHAACSASYDAPARFVFDSVIDDKGSVRWRPDIASAVLVSENSAGTLWRETDVHGHAITYRTVADAKGNRIVRAIDFVPGMPLAGTWTITFSFSPNHGPQESKGPPHTGPDNGNRIERLSDDDLNRKFREAYGPSGATQMTIAEDGKIYNPFFRFMARYVFGYTQTMETYLTAFGKFLGQDPQVTCSVES